MTIAVDLGRKATKQTNKQNLYLKARAFAASKMTVGKKSKVPDTKFIHLALLVSLLFKHVWI